MKVASTDIVILKEANLYMHVYYHTFHKQYNKDVSKLLDCYN